jgi:hypothetical protein
MVMCVAFDPAPQCWTITSLISSSKLGGTGSGVASVQLLWIVAMVTPFGSGIVDTTVLPFSLNPSHAIYRMRGMNQVDGNCR